MNVSLSPTGKLRFFRFKWIRRLGMALIFLITLFFLIHAVENWRGSRAWSHTLDDLAASGAELDLAKFLPPPVPDDDNIAMHPAFRCFMFTQSDDTRTMRLAGDPVDAADAAMVAQWDSFRQWMGARQSPYREMVDMLKKEGGPKRGMTPAMTEFLQGLAPHLPLFEQITGALERPSCRWPGMGSRRRISDIWQTSHDASPESSIVKVNNVRRCLAVQAALEGDMEAALREAGQAGDLHRVIHGQGNLLTFLFDAFLLDSEVDLIGNTLRHVPAQPADYLAAAERLSQRPSIFEQYQAVLIRERVWAIAVGSAMLESGELAVRMGGITTRISIGIQQKLGRAMFPYGWEKQVLAAQLRLLSERIKAHDPALAPLERIARETASLDSARQAFAPYRPVDSGIADFAAGLLKKDIRRALMQVALLAAHVRSATGKAPGTVAEFPAELAVKLPSSPVDGASPLVSRDTEGAWTVTYPGMQRLPREGGEVVIRMPGW